ncbi:MAG: hypothetical protein KJO07_17440 [Deltaproteobacteria bacterium]|nr:hypothetical protein [Deltaproteobacteria bacterium]
MLRYLGGKAMFSVTSEKLRSQGRRPKRRREHRGFLLTKPVVGNSLVLFREDTGTRIVTSPIIRVLGSSRVLFIETENSLYRITVHSRVVYQGCEQRFIPVPTQEVSLYADQAGLTGAGGT